MFRSSHNAVHYLLNNNCSENPSFNQNANLNHLFTSFNHPEFKDAFKIFDVDNSETITTDELLLVMKNLGMMATKEEVKEMLSEVDEDGTLPEIVEKLRLLRDNLESVPLPLCPTHGFPLIFPFSSLSSFVSLVPSIWAKRPG